MTRILLLTGKGGVGKTTVAAATAVRAATRGQRVLITSTDPAHSLADVFDVALGDAPTAVDLTAAAAEAPAGAGRLVAQQIEAQTRLERHWREVRDYLVELLSWGGVGEIEAEELVVLPGLDELFALIDLRRQVASGDHDVIVVDCAPTAETLRLLAMPDAVRWYVERVLAPGRRLARAVRPVVNRVGGMPVPEDDVFGAAERIHADLAAVHDLLTDPSRSSVRLVVNPERVVVSEAQRMATSLSLFGFGLDAVVVNRVLPDAVSDPYLATWKRRHSEQLARVRVDFAPTPVLTAPLFADELIGVAGLHRLGDVVYDGHDECAVLHHRRPVHLEPAAGGYRLVIELPFATRDEVDLNRRGADLHVRAGDVKRIVSLPAVLRRCEVAHASFADGSLHVRFVAAEPAADEPAPMAGVR